MWSKCSKWKPDFTKRSIPQNIWTAVFNIYRLNQIWSLQKNYVRTFAYLKRKNNLLIRDLSHYHGKCVQYFQKPVRNLPEKRCSISGPGTGKKNLKLHSGKKNLKLHSLPPANFGLDGFLMHWNILNMNRT